MEYHVKQGTGEASQTIESFDDMEAAIDYAQGCNPWAGLDESVWVENSYGDTVYEA